MSNEKKRQYMREYMREYNKTPKRKKYMQEYAQRPEVSDKIKEYQKNYRQSEKGKETKKLYNQRDDVKEKEKTRSRNRKSDWHKTNPEAHRNCMLKYKYGITLDDYNLMLEEQNMSCAICGSTDPGRKNANFAVDHDHKTNEIRGLLCHRCNMGLGYFDDDPVQLKQAATYLESNAEE